LTARHAANGSRSLQFLSCPGLPPFTSVHQIGDDLPYRIRAESQDSDIRGRYGLTQQTSAVYTIWWCMYEWMCNFWLPCYVFVYYYYYFYYYRFSPLYTVFYMLCFNCAISVCLHYICVNKLPEWKGKIASHDDCI